MSNSKITALTSATTPLAGAEVLPVVQSGTTKQVSVANLTAGRDVSASGLFIDANSATSAVRITQLGAGDALLVEDSASPDSSPFVINASGNVGIGSTTATEKLNLIADGRNFLELTRASTNAPPAVISFKKSRGTNASPAIVASGDNTSDFQFYGYDGTQFIQTASITSIVDGTPSTNDMPGRLVFSTTADGASTPTERVRINNAGNVGIGTTSLGGGSGTVHISVPTTGATTSRVLILDSQTQSDVTTSTSYSFTIANTQATVFTTTEINHYDASQGTFGAGSVVTNQYGFRVRPTLIGATNNYAFRGQIPTAANRYNLYMDGTAPNWFSGDVLVFGAGGLGYTTGSGGTVTQGTSRTTGVTLNKTNGAITMFTAVGSAVAATFTVTNSTVAATDTIILNQKSGTNFYILLVTAVAAGSFNITFLTTGGIASDTPVINFSVIKAVAA